MRRIRALSAPRVRRAAAATVALSLAVTLGLTTVAPAPATAADPGPSVPLPSTPSVPSQPQPIGPVPPDQASSRELRGNQPPAGEPKQGGGTSTATSLSPSATWAVSPQTGDFSWSYPLRVPPAPGGLEPDLALSYRSSAVDGRTSSTNNQASWVGDGWDLNLGFVERTYGGCADDKGGGTTPPTTVGDLCWRSDNATASYGGRGGMLVRDDASGTWRPERDDGSRVERFGGAGNGDDNGEYWKITTVDGTQWFYGSRPEARSTWTVPVFGDDAGEPCHGATFDGSRCTQAWRWNLDKVVDAHGNVMLLGYETETNAYGPNLEDTAVPYVRGGTLRKIEYGLRPGVTQPTGQVVFDLADRCVPGSTCTLDRKEDWPDTPLETRCEAATCKDLHSPSFWSSKRLASVTTQVWNGSGWASVDRWTLEHSFPDPGDGDKAALWLKSVVHTGLAGGQADLPPVTFHGVQMPNRVWQTDGLSPIIRYRIVGIISESGGVISINYAAPNCVPGSSMPASPESNTLRCFPVRWERPGWGERTDYFHKYVVESVVSSDRISSSLDQQTSYEYLGGAAWRFDQSEFTPDDKRTWNEFRGFARVRVRQGRTDDPAGPVSMTEQRFYRGMDGDKLPGGGTRQVSAGDSEGGSHPDHDWLQGVELESISYLGEGPEVVSKTISDPHWQGPTATRGIYRAYIVKPGTQRTFTTLGGGGRRVARSETSYDDRGLPTQVNDLGDVDTPADDLCIRTTYVRNTGAWLLSLPSRVEEVSVHCGATPVFPRDALSDERSSYDGQAWGQAPTKGDVTRVEVLAERPASGPVYALSQTAAYDAHGRVTASADALGRTTTTAYTPALGGPTTKVTTTSPAGFSTTADLDPASGQALKLTDPNGRVTETTYDPLGRTTAVWLANRPRNAEPPFSPNYRYSYQVRRDEPSVVTTEAIGPNGNYTSSRTLFDGLLRPRQAQAPAVGGGRLLTDTRYDSHGRVWKQTQPYFNDAPVDSTLWVASDVEIPGLIRKQYDGAERRTAAVFQAGAVERWRTTTAYGGDRVSVTPPAGGTATTTITDARDRTVELRQYRAPTPTGAFEATRYAWTPAGQLASLTDPAGNVWRYSYDLRGRQVRTADPDKGAVSSAYDDAGQLTSQTDARGTIIAHSYDQLGRRRSVRLGGPAGRLLASWTYDTVPRGKGNPATATGYDADGNAYTGEILAYTALYQPRRTSVTIPESEGLLAGTYVAGASYNPDGSLAGEALPAAGDLFAETVAHTYDDLGRPETTYGGPTGSTVSYVSQTQLTRYGEPQRLQFGSGTKRAWLSLYYDTSTRRLERSIVDAEVPRPMQADITYTYDPAGNVTRIADTPVDGPADAQCFRYDHLRRLTQAWTPSGGCAADPSVATLAGPAPYWQSFAYDLAGNRRTQTRHTTAGDTTRTYAHPDPGQPRPHAVTSITSSGPGGTTTDAYDYDPAGNTTTRGGQRLDWDELGRLAKVTDPGRGTTEFVYTADGQRLLRRDPTATTLYLGGQELRLERATGTLTGTRYYAHGGATVAVRTAAGLTWLASDHHGTANVAIDSDRLAASVRRSDPFGGPRGPQPGAWPGERGFVGGTIDASTELTHLGARDYDPTTGRFISVDPVIDPADPQQLNAYAYAANNPTTMSDPDGLRYLIDDVGHSVDSGAYRGTPPPTKPPARPAKSNAHRKDSGGSCPRGEAAHCRDVARRANEQKKQESRARQHDWGADGRRGRVGRSWGAGAPKPATPPPSGPGPGSISVCATGTVAMLWSAAVQGCIAFDRQGVGVTGEAQAGVGPAYGAAATLGVRGSTANIDDLDGWSTAYRQGPVTATVGDGGNVSVTGSVYGRGVLVGEITSRKRSYSARILDWEDILPDYVHVPAAGGAPIPVGVIPLQDLNPQRGSVSLGTMMAGWFF